MTALSVTYVTLLVVDKKGTYMYFNCEISGQKALGGLIHENNRPMT